MRLASQAWLVLRRDGPRAFLARSAALVGAKLASPAHILRDNLFSTWPKDRELPSLARRRPAFLVDPETLSDRLLEFRTRFPAAVDELVRQAELFCQHRFNLLGSGDQFLGKHIDWQLDFAHGIRFDVNHHLRQNYLRGDGSDVKLPWELARLQHLPVLALACRLTGEDRFAGEAAAQLLDFCHCNPPRFGIHWTCAMEVGLRIFSVALAATILGERWTGDAVMCRELSRLALASGRFIESRLEYDPALTSNHYLSDLLGLLVVGLAFPELADAGRFRDFAVAELKKEIGKQFYPEGANFEASLPYHRLSLEIVTAAYLLCRQHGVDLGDEFRARLRAAFGFTAAACYPDGTVPLIGDNDSGRVVKLIERADHDHHYLCEIGSALFGEPLAPSAAAPDPEAFWWLGGESVEMPPAHRRVVSTYPQSGRYFAAGEGGQLAVVCGPVGQNGNGGHAHNDALSFTFYAANRELFIDPGSFCYTADAEARNSFRSVAAHSTLMVDGAEINPFVDGLLFHLRDEARAKGDMYERDDGLVFFKGVHQGYKRLTDPVGVERELLFDPRAGWLLVRDRVSAMASHSFVQRLCLAAGVVAAILPDPQPANLVPAALMGEEWMTVAKINQDGRQFAVLTDASTDDAWLVRELWVSPRYGVRIQANQLQRLWTATGPCSKALVIIPLE